MRSHLVYALAPRDLLPTLQSAAHHELALLHLVFALQDVAPSELALPVRDSTLQFVALLHELVLLQY